jgi:hypothetical protein
MTLEDLSLISQIVGGAAVLASLIFVGVEVRLNSATTRAQVHQQLSDTFTAYLETLASHASIVATGTSSKAGLKGMTDEELLRFSFLMAGLFKIWENAFYQHKSGFLDERAWQSNVQWMLTWYHLPGVRTWWSVRKDLFAQEFQTFVEALPEPSETRAISARLREAATA